MLADTVRIATQLSIRAHQVRVEAPVAHPADRRWP